MDAIFSSLRNSVTHVCFICTSTSDSPLLHSVLWQRNLMEHFWEGSIFTAMALTTASDIFGQHNKKGGVTSEVRKEQDQQATHLAVSLSNWNKETIFLNDFLS